jgi:outer membrane protein assembly factor BamB
VQDGGTSYAEAFVKLSPKLKVVDWFLDDNFAALTRHDQDVGSGGPILVPGKNLIVGAGKAGHLYVLDSENMGHMVTGNTPDRGFDAVQSFYGSPLVWKGEGTLRLYIWGPDTSARAYAFPEGATTFSAMNPLSSGDAAVTPPGPINSVAILALSTNGDVPGTGILWANKPEKNPNLQRVPGALYALDPLTLDVLWQSGDSILPSGTTAMGSYAKFVPPVIANGKVYIPGSTSTIASGEATGADIAVYGLLAGK